MYLMMSLSLNILDLDVQTLLFTLVLCHECGDLLMSILTQQAKHIFMKEKKRAKMNNQIIKWAFYEVI